MSDRDDDKIQAQRRAQYRAGLDEMYNFYISMNPNELAVVEPPNAAHDAKAARNGAAVAKPDKPKNTTPVYADKTLNRSALKALPNPEPLIADTLDQGTVALLYGKGEAQRRSSRWTGRCPLPPGAHGRAATSSGGARSTSPQRARSGSRAALPRGKLGGAPKLPTVISPSCPSR
jgi:hypothetical protein